MAVKWHGGGDHGFQILLFGSLAIAVVCVLWSIVLLLLVMFVLPLLHRVG